MWVIRGGEHDRLVDRFVDQGVVALDFPQVPDAEILTRSEIRRFLPKDQSTAALDAQEGALSAFVREIRVGDSVLAPDPLRGEVVVGTVTGSYEFLGEGAPDDLHHRRAVDWLARHAIGDLPTPVQKVARQRLILEQHRDAEWSGYLAQVRDQAVGRDPKDRRPISASATPRRARAASPSKPVAPPKPVLTMRTCTSCFLQTHPDRMRGDICLDCAE